VAVRSFRLSRVARAAAIAVVATALTSAAAGTAAPAGATGLVGLVCAQRLLQVPTRLATALDHGVSAVLVGLQNGLTLDELADLAADDTTWVDECGQLFVADHAARQDQQVTADAVPAAGVPSDVFALSSRPTSTRTIYLDFDGATYSGTRWKDGAEIVSPAYSIDADRTTFNDTERAQVYLAWRSVAEDYAPFDVNVTTQRPDPSALTRTSSTDQTYGIPVVITPTNSVGSGCGCGGISYVGVFGSVGATDYQPAWIFTNGSGTGGYNVGQIVSHEVGHTFGLSHDGTSQDSYYAGAKGWAPIMGASYNKRASHWSSGEYADANNLEDDTAIIARTAPVLADDHANGAVGAARLAAGTTTTGTITTRTDTDAFTFSAYGRTALAVAGPAGLSDLDVRLTILNPLGAAVATIDPTADVSDDASMSATWFVDLPATPATYVAVVDGTGFGTPSEAGRYSDYGSLGAYAVTLSTGGSTATPPPTTTTTPTATTTEPTASTSAAIAFVTTRLPAAHAGSVYRASIRFSGPVSEARVDWRLPRGLRWHVVGDRIEIRGRVRTSSAGRFATVLSGDSGSVRRVFRLVVR
jgi:hypothetical protein